MENKLRLPVFVLRCWYPLPDAEIMLLQLTIWLPVTARFFTLQIQSTNSGGIKFMAQFPPDESNLRTPYFSSAAGQKSSRSPHGMVKVFNKQLRTAVEVIGTFYDCWIVTSVCSHSYTKLLVFEWNLWIMARED